MTNSPVLQMKRTSRFVESDVDYDNVVKDGASDQNTGGLTFPHPPEIPEDEPVTNNRTGFSLDAITVNGSDVTAYVQPAGTNGKVFRAYIASTATMSEDFYLANPALLNMRGDFGIPLDGGDPYWPKDSVQNSFGWTFPVTAALNTVTITPRSFLIGYRYYYYSGGGMEPVQLLVVAQLFDYGDPYTGLIPEGYDEYEVEVNVKSYVDGDVVTDEDFSIINDLDKIHNDVNGYMFDSSILTFSASARKIETGIREDVDIISTEIAIGYLSIN